MVGHSGRGPTPAAPLLSGEGTHDADDRPTLAAHERRMHLPASDRRRPLGRAPGAPALYLLRPEDRGRRRSFYSTRHGSLIRGVAKALIMAETGRLLDRGQPMTGA